MRKVMLCDDHQALRQGLCEIINSFEKFIVIAQASQGEEAISYLKTGIQPDILVLDLSMPPGMCGYEVAKFVTASFPTIKILIFSMHVGDYVLQNLKKIGVSGYVPKTVKKDDLQNAMYTVLKGEKCFFGESTPIISQYNIVRKEPEITKLTKRELEVAYYFTTEKAYKEIASILNISPNTLENIRIRIFHKTGMKTRTEVALFMIRAGLVT